MITELKDNLLALRPSNPKEAMQCKKLGLKRMGDGSWATTNPFITAKWLGLDHPDVTELRGRLKKVIDASQALSSDLEVRTPAGLSLLPFQKAGVEFLLGHKNVLLADGMGSGKTIQLIGALNSLPLSRNVLIVCPASLKLNWQREYKKWSVIDRGEPTVVKSGNKPTLGVTIINYDILSKHKEFLYSVMWDVLVFDECHMLQTPAAQRTKIATRLKAHRTICMSGTPITSRPINLYPVARMLDPIGFSDYMAYAYRYCDAKRTRWGFDLTGSSNHHELAHRLRSSFMIRREKEDILKDLPAKVRQVIEVGDAQPVDKKILKALGIKDIDSLDVTEFRKLMSMQGGESGGFGEISTLRKEAGLAKLTKVVEFLRTAADSSQKIVVFAHHKEVIKGIVASFAEGEVVSITGDTSMNQRQEAVDRFQNDLNVKVFVGNILAAGVGLTLTASSHVIFAELDWVPGLVEQCEDRVHRIGQKAGSVLIQYLVTGGSIEGRMASAIANKSTVIDTVVNDPYRSEVFQ